MTRRLLNSSVTINVIAKMRSLLAHSVATDNWTAAQFGYTGWLDQIAFVEEVIADRTTVLLSQLPPAPTEQERSMWILIASAAVSATIVAATGVAIVWRRLKAHRYAPLPA